MTNERADDAIRRMTNYLVQRTDGWVLTQLDACTRCGLCATACPFFLGTNNPQHIPVRKIEPLFRVVKQEFGPIGWIRDLFGRRNEPGERQLTEWAREAYLACTVCNRCTLACPMGIDLGALIQLTREGLAQAGATPYSLADALERQKTTGSPLGVTQSLFEERLHWLSQEEGIELPLDRAGVEDLLVFTSVELIKFPGNLVATAKILNAAQESWTLSRTGREAINFATFAGDTEAQEMFIRRIAQSAETLGVHRIILSECGHAYDAVRRVIRQLYGSNPPFVVENILETIARLLRDGRIRLKDDRFLEQRITFHDACKLQRLGGLIEEPRFILHTIAPETFVEMTPNREAQICCGGGGGVIANPEADEIRMKAFAPKVEQLEQVAADVVVTACSTCRLQFMDGSRHYNLGITVRGITEMVAEALIT